MEKDTAKQWLIDFMKEINDQDNRATANPYYYELRHMEKALELKVDRK